MTDRPDLSSLPSYKAPKRSLLSARKLALMASVVAGLGAATYGFSPPPNPADLFTTPCPLYTSYAAVEADRGDFRGPRIVQTHP